MNAILLRLAVSILFIILVSSCDNPDAKPNDIGDLSFDGFISSYRLPLDPTPLPAEALPPGSHCTALPDGPPYPETIRAAQKFISKHVDPKIVQESTGHLSGGIRFRQTRLGNSFPYSAYYGQRSIQLYDKLFEFRCLEDIVSTLLHEMVHAVQMSRYLEGSDLPAAFDLESTDPPWLHAEIMADSYQILVSKELGLLSAAHAAKILRLHNRRRAQLTQSISPAQ